MANSIKKRGQKIVRKFSRVSVKARAESKEHIRENVFERITHIFSIKLLILEWSLLMVALILLAATQAFWFTGTYAEDGFVGGGTYSEATIGAVNSMNPLFASTSSEKVLSKLMFSTLTTVDYSGNVGMGLAKSLIASENGRVWTMKLRDDLKWSDDQPITNEDVMFTIDLIKNPATNTNYSTNLASVNVSEKETGEIVFTLPSAYADFAAALEIPIVPKHELEDASYKTLVEDDFSTTPVTSGAFSFNAKQAAGVTGGEIVYLSANPNYYLGKPMVNTFAVYAYETKPELIAAMNSSTVTATAELSGSDVKEVTSAVYNQKNSSIANGAFVFFNTSSGKLKNREFRDAIRRGIDLGHIRSAAPDTIAIDYPLINSQIALGSYPALPSYDINYAKNKIAEISGGEAVHINIATVNTGFLPYVAELLGEELRELGLDAEVTAHEETQDFVANIISRRNYDILVYEIELGAEPDLLPYYHSSQASTAGLNLSNYRNTLVDDLLIGARETLDLSLRAKKYESFLDYWVNDVPAIGLYQANMTYLYNKNVRTYSDNVRLVTGLDRFSDVNNFAVNKASLNKTP